MCFFISCEENYHTTDIIGQTFGRLTEIASNGQRDDEDMERAEVNPVRLNVGRNKREDCTSRALEIAFESVLKDFVEKEQQYQNPIWGEAC